MAAHDEYENYFGASTLTSNVGGSSRSIGKPDGIRRSNSVRLIECIRGDRIKEKKININN